MNDLEQVSVSVVIIPTLCGFELYDETSKETLISWDHEGDREGDGLGTFDDYRMPEESRLNWAETMAFRWQERVGRIGALDD